MLPRIVDLRIDQAQRHGIIVGLPRIFAEEVAALADYLSDCHIWSDVTLVFNPGQVQRHAPKVWRVPVSGGWWITFQWVAPFGPVGMQLWR